MAEASPPRPLPDLRRHFVNSRVASQDFADRGRVSLPDQLAAREALITTHVVQTSPDLGIYGAAIRHEDKVLPVGAVAELYFSPTLRQSVHAYNDDIQHEVTRDYYDGTAAALEVPREAVQAAVFYYDRHRRAFRALDEVNKAKSSQDPLVKDTM